VLSIMVWVVEDTADPAPLQVKLDEKAREAERIRGEIEKAKLDAQLLRLKLEAHGISDGSLIPKRMTTGGKPRQSDLQYQETLRLIMWLAENCDTSSKQNFIVPDPMVHVGSETVFLGHMTQWKLNVPGGLRLSIPTQSELEVATILEKARSCCIDDGELERFATEWVLMTTDLVQEATPIPAIFLVSRECQRACVISSWPCVPPAQPMPEATFDPNAFFSSSGPPRPSMLFDPPLPQPVEQVIFSDDEGYVSTMAYTEHGLEWIRHRKDSAPVRFLVEELGIVFDANEQFTVTGPHGPCVLTEPKPGPKQRWLVSGLVASALEHGVRVQRPSLPMRDSDESVGSPSSQQSMSSGDTVEVQYQGHWLRGVLQAVYGETAHVRCDVDTNGVITVAPLDRVRPAGRELETPRRLYFGEAESEHIAESQC
jgi:hypothetical protein